MQGWSRAFRRKRWGTFVHYACSTALEVKRIPLRLRCLRTRTRSAMPVVASGEGQQVRAVIARSKDAPVELVPIVVPDPGPGEALVKVLACGVCHTDLHYRQGGIGNDYPYLLGHEAAGIVESVGTGVHGLGAGDYVILNWRAVCGTCRACRRGRPWYCFATFNASQRMTLEDGTELSPALGIGAFVDKTLVAAGQCTKVDPAARPAVAGLLGCGVMAGLGAALNTSNVSRGDSVAVIGCCGADVAIDAVGRPETYTQAFYGRDLAGTVVLVGVPTPEMKLELPLLDVFGRGGSLKSSWYGDCLPVRNFPMLIDLYLQGRLPLDAFVSEEIAIGEIEAAFDKMDRGDVLRSVVIMENADRAGTRA